MIIHSPIISGSLTFADGGTFTLPDNGIYSGSFSGSIAVHQVKSHLVPDINVTYDLGSSTNRFRDLYLSNNTIDFPSGSFGFGGNGFGFSDPNGDPAPIVAAEVKVIDSADGSFAKLSVVGGTLTTTAFDPFGVESAFDMKSQLSGSFTGSFLGEMLATNGVVSGSSQITIGSVTGFNTFSSSISDTFSGLSSNYVDLIGIPAGIVSGSTQLQSTFDLKADVSALNTQTGRIDAILSSADADKDTFAEIVTLINSVDTTNDSAFAGFVTSSNAAQGVQDGRLTALETETGSIATAQSVQDGRLDTLEGTDILVSLTGDVVGSGTITDLGDVTISTTIQPNSVALGTDTTGNYMSNVSAGNAGISISHTQGEGSTATISLVNGVVSGSSQITITESQISDLQSYVTTNSAQALGSATNVLTLSSNTLTLSRGDGSTDTVDLSAYLDEDSRAISSGTLNSVSGIVTFTRDDASTFTLDLSGLLDDTNLVTSVAGRTGVIVLTSSDVSEGSRLYYTDARVKTKLNVEAVVSGSATQVRSFLNVENGATADQTGAEIKTALFAESDTNNLTDTLLSKLNGIESGATANQTAGEIKTALFAESDTNNLTDTLLSKLNGIESGATADQTAGEIKTAYESNSNTNAFTDTLLSKLNGIEAGATADQTAEEIQDIVGGMVSTNTESGISVTYDDTAGKLNFSVTTQSDNNFTSALLSKLNGIEAGANVTDAANVDAAGAVMNSDTSTSAMSFVIDEDTMTSNTATKVPTQQSVKTYVDNKVSTLIDSAPGALDTLNELAAALGDDANFSTTVTNSLATKANSSVTISAGNGLTGGGNLTANRTLSMSGAYTGTFAVTGGITATADVIAYASSDRRLKDNIVNIENPIEKVQKLNGVTWEWNDNADELQKSTPTVGVIAQEVEEVLPQLVNTRDNGYKAVDYAKLTGLLIEAIKEQQVQIDELKSKLG